MHSQKKLSELNESIKVFKDSLNMVNILLRKKKTNIVDLLLYI